MSISAVDGNASRAAGIVVSSSRYALPRTRSVSRMTPFGTKTGSADMVRCAAAVCAGSSSTIRRTRTLVSPARKTTSSFCFHGRVQFLRSISAGLCTSRGLRGHRSCIPSWDPRTSGGCLRDALRCRIPPGLQMTLLAKRLWQDDLPLRGHLVLVANRAGKIQTA